MLEVIHLLHIFPVREELLRSPGETPLHIAVRLYDGQGGIIPLQNRAVGQLVIQMQVQERHGLLVGGNGPVLLPSALPFQLNGGPVELDRQGDLLRVL